MEDPILTFEGEYSFLSNFYPSPFTIKGTTFPTVEHVYQAMKSIDASEQQKIARASTPGRAKRMGRQIVQLRPEWESLKIEVMTRLVRIKFSVPELRQKLLATGEARLEEGNRHYDTWWGIHPIGSGKGRNELGRILMQIRNEIRYNCDENNPEEL